MQVTINQAKSLLNKATGFIQDYDFTLNPYRGCQFGCDYCYASAFSPNTQLKANWGDWVMVKENSAELLVHELERTSKKYDRPIRIYMSSVTDPYQPIEQKVQITRKILQVLIKYQPVLVLQTRSPMVVRDIDLLRQFHNLRINISIPTASERVRKDFENRSPSVKARLQTVEKLRHQLPSDDDYKIKFAVTMTPLLPSYDEDLAKFIEQLATVDRIVIQPFHSSQNQSLKAATPAKAIELKRKYEWWYQNEDDNYHNLLNRLELINQCYGVEIFEGREGFGYD
ncbi:radical SAM protein [Synechocystis sp. PCC 7339]|nr:radical SAM protein [Synechocystis sp. PCC 7338]UAJ74320.1 radical SAM protein [Synechocystis sp. PCC 7339]